MTDEEMAKKRADKFYKKYAADIKKLGFQKIKGLFFGDEKVEIVAYLQKDKVKHDKA